MSPLTRTNQEISRETSQLWGGSTHHLISGTPQEERVVDPIGTTLSIHQESNMAQLMQILIKMVQIQQ